MQQAVYKRRWTGNLTFQPVFAQSREADVPVELGLRGQAAAELPITPRWSTAALSLTQDGLGVMTSSIKKNHQQSQDQTTPREA